MTLPHRTPKTCRFVLAWQNYRVGDEIQPPATLRDWLVANGYVEVVDDLPASPIRAQGKRGKRDLLDGPA